MSNRIDVSPDQVDHVSRLFKSSSQESQQILSRFNSILNAMSGHWDGNRKKKFESEFHQLQKTIKDYQDGLHQISNKLHQVAENFRQIDQA